MSEEIDEPDAWRRLRGGDADGFLPLYETHRDRVYGHSLRLLGNVHDAEDATAVVFLHLWRRRSEVRLVAGSVVPWLLTTAGNIARNIKRSQRRHRSMLERLPRTHDAESAEDHLTAATFDRAIADALNQLSRVDRSLVALVILEGFPIALAAESLGLTPSAAKTRLYRIRGRLATTLAGHPILQQNAEEMP